MALRIRCACCSVVAEHYFQGLDSAFWAVCTKHRGPFEAVMVELDPEEYDIEAYLAENHSDQEGDGDDPGETLLS